MHTTRRALGCAAGYDRKRDDFCDVTAEAEELAKLIVWKGCTFAACMQATRYRRINLIGPNVAIAPVPRQSRRRRHAA